MTTKTLYVQDVAAEYAGGCFVTETKIDSWILCDLLDRFCNVPSNTCGEVETYSGGIYEGEIYTAGDDVIANHGEYLAEGIVGKETINFFSSGGDFGKENDQRVTDALGRLLANTTQEDRDDMVRALQNHDAYCTA
tara:strand:+ start:77 stop:484 length:408 start_codon:yes stop_codon:yes gene_type:complete